MSKKITIASGNPNHGRNWIRKEKRYAIYLRDGMACAYCDRDLTGEQDGGVCTLDHLSPNGGNHETNLVTCCRPCNTAKAGRHVSQFASERAQEKIALLISKDIDIKAAKRSLGAPIATAPNKENQKVFFPPAQMAELAITSVQRLAHLAGEHRIPAATAEGYEAISTLCALLQIRSSPTAGERMAEDKARQQKADADKAEVEAMLAIGSAVLAADVEPLWEDAATRSRVVIESYPGLTEGQRDGIIAKLAAIKLSAEEGA